MNYLYGDSKPSKLTSNFLEFLRDAMDFAVFALEADARLAKGKKKIEELRRESAAESQRLAKFIAVVASTIESGEKGAAESPTAQCGARLTASVADAERATNAAIEQRLAAEIAQVDAEEIATRKACGKALGALLVPHQPPDATGATRVALGAGGRYEATRSGTTDFGLAWTFEVAVDEASLWSAPVRIERLTPHLEIRAPQLSGWITKEVKIRPQRLEKLIVTELEEDGKSVRVKLRGEAATAETGFDLELRVPSNKLAMARIGPSEDASVGTFDVAAEDLPALVQLVEKLRASAAELASLKLVTATFDGADFDAQPSFVDVVQRLVGAMAPIVREISEHSLTPHELVIRRPLANDRREEIFVAKSTLRDKYAPLGDAARAVFAPLALEPPPARTHTAEFPPAAASPPVVRAELPRSKPPPPIPAPSARPPVPKAAQRPTAAEPVVDVSDALVEDARTSRPTLDAKVDDDARPTIEVPESHGRNAGMVAALKKIATLARNGRVDEAYIEYATLFSSPAFADYRPEDQRQALRLMLQAKTAPPKSEPVLEAHRSALVRLGTLVAALGEPGDYEMLGMTNLLLGDTKAATAAFTTALEKERAKKPDSPLCASLEKRLASG